MNTNDSPSRTYSLLSSLAALSKGEHHQGDELEQSRTECVENFNRDIITGGVALDKMRRNFDRLQMVWGFGSWEWDLVESRFTVFKSHLWRSMGYLDEEVEQLDSLEKSLEFVHRDDQQEMITALEDENSYGSTFEYSYRIRCKNGSFRWLHLRAATLRDEHNKLLFMAGVNYDITNEKYAEQSLRDNQALFQRILKSSNDGIWEWSRKDGQLSFSEGCWRLLGYSVEDADMGRRHYRLWRARIHPMDRPQFDLAHTRAIQVGIEVDVEYRIKNILDEWIWIRSRGDVIYDEDGMVEHLSGANIDITELKRAEEKLISAKSLAERANHAKSEFLSNMSHELKTPMNAIMGFSQLFNFADNITIEQRENINEINRAGKQLLNLINDVLELAKIEAGKLNLTLTAVAITPLINSIFNDGVSEARERKISLSFEPQHFSETFVRADQYALRQTILNLINNCIKSCTAGGRVIVSLSSGIDSNLVISVRDNGRGVPASMHEDLFEPFGKNSIENQVSGIGLAIGKQLVELMKGELSFESEEGVGTCFQIHLPIEKSERPLDFNATEPQQNLSKSQYLTLDEGVFIGKKILYIEAYQANLEELRQFFLQFSGVSFEVADESITGLYKARNLAPDLIILDINMPGLDGYEILTILRNDPTTEKIPVVALSDLANVEDISRSLEAGFSDFIKKPVDPEQFAGIAASLLV